jgi:hypothetical protein
MSGSLARWPYDNQRSSVDGNMLVSVSTSSQNLTWFNFSNLRGQRLKYLEELLTLSQNNAFECGMMHATPTDRKSSTAGNPPHERNGVYWLVYLVSVHRDKNEELQIF